MLGRERNWKYSIWVNSNIIIWGMVKHSNWTYQKWPNTIWTNSNVPKKKRLNGCAEEDLWLKWMRWNFMMAKMKVMRLIMADDTKEFWRMSDICSFRKKRRNSMSAKTKRGVEAENDHKQSLIFRTIEPFKLRQVKLNVF